MKIAILYICTGEYGFFWKVFYLSFKKYFLKNSDVHFYVFSDNDKLDYIDNDDVHFRHLDSLEWPYGTLFRFHTFLTVEEDIRLYDYCFFFNSNMMCLQDITEEEFLPLENDLLVVKHAYSYEKKISECSWERNVNSNAYVAPGREKVYVWGGINGGKANAFMDMAIELKKRIDEDLKKDIIALWHDESHINRYILDFPDYRLLDLTYCYPEGWLFPFEQKILLLDKLRSFNNYKIKNKDGILNSDEYYMVAKAKSRFSQYFQVTRRLLYCKNRGLSFADYLYKKNIRSIAVYGYKNLGQVLLDELKETKIEIIYFIDSKISAIEENIPVVKDVDQCDCSKVDGVIVAELFDFYSLYRQWIDIKKYPIYSLEVLVHDMYINCYK